ncbi:hypothetical protein PspLS_12016 [Pyricularia sp. CBS 133598]|nr:hypothetical protein PspLS_12016 [Pyricularia sp. CBS 133598]
MSPLNIFLGLLPLAAIGIQGAALGLPSGELQDLPVLPEGFKIVETQWNVDIRPGEKIILNGTIESVYAQLLELNPNYETDNAEQIAARLSQLKQETAALKNNQLARRDHTECGHAGSTAPVPASAVWDGVQYLWRVGGEAWIGPGECSRVSCSWTAGIGWCSYRNERWKSPGGFPWIGHATNIVLQECNTWLGVVGRRYHDSHVAVWVDYHRC